MAEICSPPLANAILEAGFCAYELAIDLDKPRGVLAIGIADTLVLERGTQSVVHLYDSDGDGIADSKRTVASALYLNHGLALMDDYIYASSDTVVYRWAFSDDFDTIGDIETVVVNMNADGQGGAPQGHTTRTLIFDEAGRLYVSVGSHDNVDSDSHRSRIRRFDFSGVSNVTFPIDFQTGEVFADGLRNEVGLAFDSFGVLWGVENSADNLFREDLGGDIHHDNPAEELNRFREEDAGKHWGYPYCWTEYTLPVDVGNGRGTVWAWPDFLNIGQVTDAQCQSRALYEPPVVSMQGHSAPLGITFYTFPDERPSECGDIVPFPKRYDKNAFIAFHGSWNRDIPTGYKVVYIPFDSDGNVTGEPVDFLAHAPPNAEWEDGFRPVDVDFDACGRLIVTSDGTDGVGSKVVYVQYVSGDDMVPSTPTSSPPPSDGASIHGPSASGCKIYRVTVALTFLFISIW